VIHCTCMVQAGQISETQQARLRTETNIFSKRHFGSEPSIQWVEVPEGSGFTEAKPSTSVVVSMNADRSLAPSEREPLLRELGDIWIEHAQRSSNEVVTVISDPQS